MNGTRRSFLGATAAIGIGVAGCLGRDGADPSDPADTDDDTSDGTDTAEPPEPPIAGDPDADVTVAVYEDYACGGCANFKANEYPRIRTEYVDPELIRYEHRDFPIPVDETWSWAVASAGRAVYEEAGDDAFWSFSAAIYEQHSTYSYDGIEALANEQDLDGAAIRGAAEELTYEETIESNRSYGIENGVDGTPAVFVDGERVDDPFADWETAIEAALE